MTTKAWAAGPETSGVRVWAATVLLVLARSLLKSARSVRRASRGGRSTARVLEFYAEAGAPEGALYVDGQLVGHVYGVTRL